ncbi:MAG: isoleucine--tRNA ligase [Planctomycetes bacterium]|nr:isoleucine--tRNA ligase [Planctomycetota bacterium]
MAVFRAVDPRYDFPRLEKEVLRFWKDRDVVARSLARNRDSARGTYVFYEGPPTANGLPHNGHVLTRVMKDIFPRFKTMRGYHVPRKAGWDTHGLPVEVEVEKELGIHGGDAIAAYGVEPFTRRCIESVFRYTEEWERLTERIGFWIDLGDAYVTYHTEYVESVWWALSELFKKGLLYRGHKVVWWWPAGGTALSAGEVGQGYRTVTDPSVVLRFPVAGDPTRALLAWTTTPWTLPSNVALAVGEDLEYAEVAVAEDGGRRRYLLAAARVDAILGDRPRELVRTWRGRELVGLRYEPLFTFAAPAEGKSFEVVPADFVTLEQGTGVVHIAPAFGEDDYRLGREQQLGFLQLVEPDGTFGPGTGPYAGRFCKDCDRDLVRELRERGRLFAEGTVRHEYPFCWRAEQDPLIQYARRSWFIRTRERIDAVIANNRATRWYPAHIQEGRYGDFLANNVDWALSRERYWGTPLNIWVNDVTGVMEAPASVAEILARNPAAFRAFEEARARDATLNEHLRVHKPWIDQVSWTRPGEPGVYRRVPEVIDCWFDSGCMPFGQFGYPHRGRAAFAAAFPADFISEAIDQTRGWFYSLMTISTLVFDRETQARLALEPPRDVPHPYRHCIVLGHVCDRDGKKESKSRRNYTPPDVILERVRMEMTAVVDDGAPPFSHLVTRRIAAGEVGLARDDFEGLDLERKDATVRLVRGGVALEHLRPVDTDKAEKFAAAGRSAAFRHPVVLDPESAGRLGVKTGDPVDLEDLTPAPGADAFRWFFFVSPPWNNTRHSLAAVRTAQKEFLITLYNVYGFFTIYANIDRFDPAAGGAVTGLDHAGLTGGAGFRPVADRRELDRWILSELQLTAGEVTAALEDYQVHEAARRLNAFVDGLSNWYLRRSRARFWMEGRPPEKLDAYWTLYECLVTLARLLAPFTPFLAEDIYRNLAAGPLGDRVPDSVHLTDYPEPVEALVDRALSARMAAARDVVSLGLAARSHHRLKVRQPLRGAQVCLADPALAGEVSKLAPTIAEELNVKTVTFPASVEDCVHYEVRPNFKVLGPRLGSRMPLVKKALGAADPAQLRAALAADGAVALALEDGETVVLGPEEVEVRLAAREGYVAEGGRAGVVVLDAEITEALRREGLARDLVNRIQTLRKELALDYVDRIRVWLEPADALAAVLAEHAGYVKGETLCVALEAGPAPPGVALRRVMVGDLAVGIGLRREAAATS